MGDSNKTEQPTPRRQQKAREQGQIARSRELSNVVASIGGLGTLFLMSSSALDQWRGLLRRSLDVAFSSESQAIPLSLFWAAMSIARWVVPVMLATWSLALASSLAQGGLIFATDALTPKLERLSPAGKLRQMFSPTGVSAALKSLVPFAAILYLAFASLQQHWAVIVQASSVGLPALLPFVGGVVFDLGWKSLLVLLLWAGVDYFLVWRKLHGDLMMSRQELREEAKESEGNPAIKARIRRLQRQVRRQQMLRDTEKATVVITNPTHFAIALRYDMDMNAPIVVAKGRDLLAQQIKEAARWQGIPVLENPPLAQALYRTAEVGQMIPAKLYTAVAEILAFVYRAQAEARRKANRSTR